MLNGCRHKDISFFEFTISLDVLGELEGLMGEENNPKEGWDSSVRLKPGEWEEKALI